MKRRLAVLALFALLLFGAGLARAFERTEEREPCAERDRLRRPYFGDTHVHTAFSFDASALGVRNTPRDAYRFARGEELGLQPFDSGGEALRHARLRRPLDFAMVSDHAGLLGELHICKTPGAEGHDSLVCRIYRRWPLLSYYLVNSRATRFATASAVPAARTASRPPRCRGERSSGPRKPPTTGAAPARSPPSSDTSGAEARTGT
jgi:hypothetical protein